MAAEYLAILLKTLTDIKVALMKIEAEDETRHRLGELIVKVADCVSGIADNIEASKHSAELCAELDAYVAHINGLVAKQTDQKTADTLTFWLRHVDEVPGCAQASIVTRIVSEVKPRWTKAKRLEQADEVRRIAGMIRGVGNIIHV